MGGRSGRKLLEEQSGAHGMGEDEEEAESYQDRKGGDKGRGEQLGKCFQQHVIMKYLKKELK